MKRNLDMFTKSFAQRRTLSRQDKLTSTYNTAVRSETEHDVLDRIRRRSSKSSMRITPELASQVVKDYILPMFKSDRKRISDKKRSIEFGTLNHKRHISVADGSVLSECKLSERLSLELEQARCEIAEAQRSLHDIGQENFSLAKELGTSKKSEQTNLITIQFLMQENLRLQEELSRAKEAKGHVFQQIFAYKAIFDSVNHNFNEVSKELQDEKSTNDIRLYFIFPLNSLK